MRIVNGHRRGGCCRECERNGIIARELIRGLGAPPIWPWRPGDSEEDSEDHPRGPAVEFGAELESWRDWPHADGGGLRVGIVADVSAPMAPLDRYVEALAWTLVLGLYRSTVTEDATIWPARSAVVLANGSGTSSSGDPGRGRPRDPQELGEVVLPGAVVCSSVGDGIDVAAETAGSTLRCTVGLLVVIADAHHVTDDATLAAVQRLRTRGCAVLTLLPSLPATRTGGTGDGTDGTGGGTGTGDGAGATGGGVVWGTPSVALLAQGCEVVLLNAADPIPGRDLGRAAVRALRGADPRRSG